MGFTCIVRIGYSKSLNNLYFIVFLSQKEAVFVSKLAIKKWIYYDNPKYKKS